MANGSTNSGHMPIVVQPVVLTMVLPSKAGAAPVTVQAPMKFATLVINGRSVTIQPDVHSLENICNIINSANTGAVAFIDRHGSLQLRGDTSIGGDPVLRGVLGI